MTPRLTTTEKKSKRKGFKGDEGEAMETTKADFESSSPSFHTRPVIYFFSTLRRLGDSEFKKSIIILLLQLIIAILIIYKI